MGSPRRHLRGRCDTKKPDSPSSEQRKDADKAQCYARGAEARATIGNAAALAAPTGWSGTISRRCGSGIDATAAHDSCRRKERGPGAGHCAGGAACGGRSTKQSIPRSDKVPDAGSTGRLWPRLL